MSGPEEYLARVAEAERSGDWLGAHDAATRGVDAFPDDLALRHRAVLALARSGATARAEALFAAWGLADRADEDLAALGARIAKDGALAARGEERARLARVAAERYRAVHAATGGHYPAINAATLFLLAGDEALAAALAAQAARAAELAAQAASSASGSAYWCLATRLEAALILGQPIAADIAAARALVGADHGALGTTLRQLELVCAARGVDPAVLAPLRPPRVLHYTGHGAGDVTPARIAAYLDEHDVGYGFGGLAGGAECLIAEALLARGAELHVVLPLARPAFVAACVAPAWEARFGACLERARSVRVVADGAPDDVLLRYGAHVAMGLAVLRARHLHTGARQLALGATDATAAWTARGLPADVLPGDAAPAPLAGALAPARSVRALVFGDVKGYSKLGEAQIPRFVDGVMGRFGRVLDDAGADVLLRNSWGDGLYIVLTGAAAAARCALALQDAMRGLDLEGLGLPAACALRVAAHLGPVHHCYDAVARTPVFVGTHVTQAARIEPVTPEGEVYVTEAFAAGLALETDGYACDYVGTVPTAKGYGPLRMHLLRRT